MCSRNISAGEQETVGFYGHHTAVGNSISALLLKVLLHACFIKPGARNIMNIKIKPRPAHNPVFKLPSLQLLHHISGYFGMPFCLGYKAFFHI